MIRWLLIAALLQMPMGGVTVSSGAAPTGPTFVQSCVGSGHSGSVIPCTFGSAVTAGNQLYLCVQDGDSASVTWSGDSGTFVADPDSGTPITHIASTAVGSNITCAYVASAGGGETVVNANSTTPSFPVIMGVEVHGGTFDQSDAGVDHATNATTSASNNITPTSNGALFIGVVFTSSTSVTFTAGTNLSYTMATSHAQFGAEYATQATAAAANAQFTFSTSTHSWTHVVDFK